MNPNQEETSVINAYMGSQFSGGSLNPELICVEVCGCRREKVTADRFIRTAPAKASEAEANADFRVGDLVKRGE